MADRPAQSVYNGLRITVTQHPDGGPAFVTVASKNPRGRWDEWSTLFPAIRLDLPPASTAEQAMRMIHTALVQVEEYMR